jgi:hypothetical protein
MYNMKPTKYGQWAIALMMEVASTSETSVYIYQTACATTHKTAIFFPL